MLSLLYSLGHLNVPDGWFSSLHGERKSLPSSSYDVSSVQLSTDHQDTMLLEIDSLAAQKDLEHPLSSTEECANQLQGSDIIANIQEI